jgi:hypothetical protein
MTCDQMRELFSALVDEALSPEERVGLDAHLASCADCRRELEGFQQTVALVRSAPPVRAPVGFVDRVLAAARPAPWYRRLARRLFVPLSVKLPVEAAAVVVVAILAVVLYRETPELQRAARQETRPPAVSEAPQPANPPVTPPPATGRTSGEGRPSRPAKSQEESTNRAQRNDRAAESRSAERDLQNPEESKNAMKDARVSGQSTPVLESPPAAGRRESVNPSATPPTTTTDPVAVEKRSAPPSKTRADRESTDRVQRKEGAPGSASEEGDLQKEESKSVMKGDRVPGTSAPALESPPAAGQLESATAPTPRGAEQAARQKSAAAPVPAPAAPAPYAALAAAEVAGRLVVTDRAAAETALAGLVARLGGVVLGTRPDAGTTIVEVQVPRAAYADLLQGLARIGRWTPEREAGELPDHVRVTLRLSA